MNDDLCIINKQKIIFMKAVRIHEFGGPEVMKVEDIERPVAAPDEILVKMYASGVNPVDWVIRNGANDVLRPFLKLPMTLGWDAAGVIEEMGSDVTGFQKGDAVYGVPNFPGDGSYAEYCAAKATQFALKPERIGFNEAAGVPLAALTAWTGMFVCSWKTAGGATHFNPGCIRWCGEFRRTVRQSKRSVCNRISFHK